MESFITYTEIYDTGKTKIYKVTPRGSNDLLGKVSWYSAWRRYTFFPEPDTLFDSKCLQDITVFINVLMADRKLAKVKKGGV